MHKFHIFFKSLAILMFFCSMEINAAVYQFDETAVSFLQENKDPSILDVQDGNVYLNPESIILEKGGIFLAIDENCLLKLDNVYSNSCGIYTSVSRSNGTVGTVWPAVIKCRNCDLPFSKTIFNKGKCPRCGTQN